MAKQVLLGYSPNDFFYASAQEYMPPDCASIDPYSTTWDISCNSTNFMNNALPCVQRELCINRDRAQQLIQTENQQLGGDEKYMDSKIKYDSAIMDVINLGIGIFFAIFLIYRNQSVKK